MMRVSVNRELRVQICVEESIMLRASSVWGEMRGFEVFAAADPFHRQIIVHGGPPARGREITIVHQFAFIRVIRRGRILRWREGAGFAFSDLSQRGNSRGFPHVFIFDIIPSDEDSCVVRLQVKGRWTARWMPRAIIWFWNWWVMTLIRAAVRDHLQSLAIVKRRMRADAAHAGPVARARRA